MKKRKFFSFMLMGLLTLGATSMVTSCKDYDDDINNLQDEQASLTSQINSLQSDLSSVKTAAASHASQADLTALQGTVSSLGSQVTTAINNAASAQEAATAAQNAVDALKAQIPDVSGFATKADLANYVTATALNEQLETFKSEIQNANKEQLDQIKANVAKYDSAIGALFTAVTEVQLMGVINGSDFSEITDGTPGVVSFKAGKTVANGETFGAQRSDNTLAPDYEGKTYTASPVATYGKAQNISFIQSLLIRVNPVNAEIKPEQIKIIDSQGNDLTATTIDVVDATRYNKTLTRASKTGTWKIDIKLKGTVSTTDNKLIDGTYDKDVNTTCTFSGTVSSTNQGMYRYYVAINNTADSLNTNAAERDVVSEHDIIFGNVAPYTGATSLKDLMIYPASVTSPTVAANGLATITSRDGSNADVSRTGATALKVQNGETITVDFSQGDGPKVDKFYVVRDDNHAGGSNESELRSWKTYSYDGIVGTDNRTATVVNVDQGTGKGTFTVTMPEPVSDGDEIGFRIYAINYNGELVDVDGESFNVYVNPKQADATAGNATLLATSQTPSTGRLQITGTPLKSLPNTITFTQGDNTFTATASYYENARGGSALGASDAAKANYVVLTFQSGGTGGTGIKNWIDGTQLTGRGSTTSGGTTQQTLAVTLTKELPTAAQTASQIGFNWKENQKVNGNYTAFMYTQATQSASAATTAWTSTVSTGYNDLVNAVNFFNNANVAKVTLKIADAQWNSTDEKNETLTVNGTGTYKDASHQSSISTTNPQATLSINVGTNSRSHDFIDGTTSHASELSYDWDEVTSKSYSDVADDDNYTPVYNTSGEVIGVKYTPVFETFNITFACPLAQAYNTYAVLTGVKTPAQAATSTTPAVPAKNYPAAEVTYNVPTDFDLDNIGVTNTSYNDYFRTITTLDKQFENVVSVSAQLTRTSNKTVDYFNVSYVAATSSAPAHFHFAPLSGATMPGAATAQLLRVSFTDAFGHTNEFTLNFTVVLP